MSSLPYTDAKPVGAADFYFVINATFQFILDRFGPERLRQYWEELGTGYFSPVSNRWKEGGLEAVAGYWRAFFDAEPGSEVEVSCGQDHVTLEVKRCPAIAHLRQHGRSIIPCFCQHCYFVSESMARPAGLTVRIAGGNGVCRQTFHRRAAAPPAQDLSAIAEARC